jgi:hypothetical protein
LVGEIVLLDVVDAASARAFPEGLFELFDVFGGAGDDDFDVALVGVADPAAETDLGGLALDEPAEADPLYPSLHQIMADHEAIVPDGLLPKRGTG